MDVRDLNQTKETNMKLAEENRAELNQEDFLADAEKRIIERWTYGKGGNVSQTETNYRKQVKAK